LHEARCLDDPFSVYAVWVQIGFSTRLTMTENQKSGRLLVLRTQAPHRTYDARLNTITLLPQQPPASAAAVAAAITEHRDDVSYKDGVLFASHSALLT
jgi:hypothetical protein